MAAAIDLGRAGDDEASPPSSRDPDLRHVRYVALSPAPPDRAPSDIPFATRFVRAALLGAFAGGSLALQVTGHATAGLTVGGAIGAASAVLRGYRRLGAPKACGFVLVPWGVLVDGEGELCAVRWSGVHSLDVKYRTSGDGSVHARVAIDSVVGALVGFSSDAVDLGALAGDLSSVAAASARPLAIDLSGDVAASDGEPFVDRLLHAARTLVHAEGEERLGGLSPISYRDGRGCPQSEQKRFAGKLHDIGAQASGLADVWGLIAAVAGELRLRAFAAELSRLANNPNPAVATVARAALGRLSQRGGHEPPAAETAVEEWDALSWFVAPDELARLRVWRDQ